MSEPFLRFPSGFLWGAATSAHQTEGSNPNTDWWRSERTGRVPFCSGEACDSWHRWPEDVALLRTLGLNAYRFSVEWARIEPEPGTFDQAALDHYRRLVEALRAAGIEPLVTLHHFTNPLWLAEQGGWASPEVVPRFAAYAERVGRQLGDLVQWWITVNEPSVLGIFGYMTGLWPPHRTYDLRGFLRSQRYLFRGHRQARLALKAQRPDALVGMALHLNPLEPVRRYDPTDWVAAYLYDWLWQGRLLNRVVPHLDWVGVNYYFRLLVWWNLLPWSLLEPPRMGSGEKTEFGWESYPEGLYRVLRRVGRSGKPVIITENGIADADDDQRARFIVQHLGQAHRAVRDGLVDLRGYLHWSLLDNFEWAEGFQRRFGLAEVDFATQRRVPRPSAYVYRQIATANGLDAALLGQPPERVAAGR